MKTEPLKPFADFLEMLAYNEAIITERVAEFRSLPPTDSSLREWARLRKAGRLGHLRNPAMPIVDKSRIDAPDGSVQHCNNLAVSNLNLLLSESPMEGHLKEFWWTLLRRKVRMLVHLGIIYEGGRRTQTNLYPTEIGKQRFIDIAGSISVTCSEVNWLEGGVRETKLTLTVGAKVRHVVAYNFPWPISSAPASPLAAAVVVEKLLEVGAPSQIVCSCAGRSGAFAFSAVAASRLLAGVHVNPLSLVKEIRRERGHAMQGPRQFLFATLVASLVVMRAEKSEKFYIDHSAKEMFSRLEGYFHRMLSDLRSVVVIEEASGNPETTDGGEVDLEEDTGDDVNTECDRTALHGFGRSEADEDVSVVPHTVDMRHADTASLTITNGAITTTVWRTVLGESVAADIYKGVLDPDEAATLTLKRSVAKAGEEEVKIVRGTIQWTSLPVGGSADGVDPNWFKNSNEGIVKNKEFAILLS